MPAQDPPYPPHCLKSSVTRSDVGDGAINGALVAIVGAIVVALVGAGVASSESESASQGGYDGLGVLLPLISGSSSAADELQFELVAKFGRLLTLLLDMKHARYLEVEQQQEKLEYNVLADSSSVE